MISDLRPVTYGTVGHPHKARRIAARLYLSGMGSAKIAWLFGVTPATVRKWRDAYLMGYLNR